MSSKSSFYMYLPDILLLGDTQTLSCSMVMPYEAHPIVFPLLALGAYSLYLIHLIDDNLHTFSMCHLFS